MSVVQAAAAQLTWPVSWYAGWVRAHPDNAKQLERLAQTVAMVVSDPGNLINMEGCWSLSKLYAYLNEVLVHTAGRRVPAAEVTAYVLHVVQEVECLFELAVRKYRGHRVAWDALLALEAVKCVLNLCVHRQFFLVRWVCAALVLSLRRMRVRLTHARQHVLQLLLLLRSNAKNKRLCNGSQAASTAAAAVAQRLRRAGGPGGAALVIPRVMSSCVRVTQLHEEATRPPRHLTANGTHHHHHAPQQQHHDDSSSSASLLGDGEATTKVVVDGQLVCVAAAEAQLVRDEAASVPFTWTDALGMTLDAYLLLRPVLLVGAARHLFLRRYGRGGGALVAMAAAALPRLSLTPAPLAGEGEASQLHISHAAVTAAPHASLFPSWRLWCAFTLLDLLVVLLSRFVRQRRVPIVYVGAHDESSSTVDGVVAAPASSEHDDSVSTAKAAAVSDDGAAHNGDVIDVRNGNGVVVPANVNNNNNDNDNNNNNSNAAAGAVPMTMSPVQFVPAVVSRDVLRVQHALRNLVKCFTRDPFFSAVLKRYVYMHLVQGTINKVPLLGPLLGFQVGYFLAMQHYSFLYSVGQ